MLAIRLEPRNRLQPAASDNFIIEARAASIASRTQNIQLRPVRLALAHPLHEFSDEMAEFLHEVCISMNNRDVPVRIRDMKMNCLQRQNRGLARTSHAVNSLRSVRKGKRRLQLLSVQVRNLALGFSENRCAMLLSRDFVPVGIRPCLGNSLNRRIQGAFEILGQGVEPAQNAPKPAKRCHFDIAGRAGCGKVIQDRDNLGGDGKFPLGDQILVGQQRCVEGSVHFILPTFDLGHPLVQAAAVRPRRRQVERHQSALVRNQKRVDTRLPAGVREDRRAIVQRPVQADVLNGFKQAPVGAAMLG